MGTSRVVHAARLPDGPADMPRAHHVGLAIIAKLERRNQSVVVELSWSQMAPIRALPACPSPNCTRSGVRAAVVGALCKLRGTDGMNLCQLAVESVHFIGGG
jgi:hypothetical protein